MINTLYFEPSFCTWLSMDFNCVTKIEGGYKFIQVKKLDAFSTYEGQTIINLSKAEDEFTKVTENVFHPQIQVLFFNLRSTKTATAKSVIAMREILKNFNILQGFFLMLNTRVSFLFI